MENTSIEFKTGKIIELSFATVIAGKEDQLFGDYFPKVTPIVGELGGQPLGSYVVTNSSSRLGDPKMGAIFQWGSINAFNKLHKEPRFLEIKHIRDNALQSLSNGHFFTVNEDTAVVFDEGQSYALIAQMDDDGCGVSSPLVEMTPASGEDKKDYSPVKIQIVQWDECCDKILQEGSSDIFKFILNMPK
jgi:hypothetical protein